MDRALRVLVHRCGLELAEAAQVLCSSPAHAMGLADVGAIAPGRRADLVVLDQDLLVRRVMRAGEWVSSGSVLVRVDVLDRAGGNGGLPRRVILDEQRGAQGPAQVAHGRQVHLRRV